MPARAVILDGFGTLIEAPNLFDGQEAAERMKKFGYQVDPDQINRGISRYWRAAEVREIEDFLRWWSILFECGIAHPVDEAVFDCILAETSVVMRDCRPSPGLYDMLGKIRGAQIPMALCSNASRIHLLLEEQLDFRRIFGAGFIVSYEQGVSKADGPKLFELAAESIGVPPEDCVYLDDGLKHLRTARELGMTTVLAYNAPETKSRIDLKATMTSMDCPFGHHVRKLPDLVNKVLPELGVEL